METIENENMNQSLEDNNDSIELQKKLQVYVTISLTTSTAPKCDNFSSLQIFSPQ